MHAEIHVEHLGQKYPNFLMSDCHLEHLVRPLKCWVSDSECLWNTLGRNIFRPGNHHSRTKYFLPYRWLPRLRYRDRADRSSGPVLRQMQNTYPAKRSEAFRGHMNSQNRLPHGLGGRDSFRGPPRVPHISL